MQYNVLQWYAMQCNKMQCNPIYVNNIHIYGNYMSLPYMSKKKDSKGMQRPSPHPKPGGCLCPFQVDFTWGSRALQLPLRRHGSGEKDGRSCGSPTDGVVPPTSEILKVEAELVGRHAFNSQKRTEPTLIISFDGKTCVKQN